MKKNKLIILFLFIFSSSAFGASYYTAKAPKELKIVIESLGRELMDDAEKKIYTSLVEKFNNLQNTDKTDFYIIAKTEIYKGLAGLAESGAINSDQLQNELLDQIKFNNYSKLSIWFIQLLKIDSNKIKEALSDPQLKSKNNKILKRKIIHLNKLINLIRINSPESFNLMISKAMKSALQRIYNYMLYIERLSFNTQKIELELPIFSLINFNESSNEERLTQILAPALSMPADRAEESIKEWSPSDDMEKLKIENYTPPKRLPNPVSDWDDDNQIIIDLFDENYTPPKTLPLPINDWDALPTNNKNESLDDKFGPKDPEDDWLLQ